MFTPQLFTAMVRSLVRQKMVQAKLLTESNKCLITATRNKIKYTIYKLTFILSVMNDYKFM
jgi:hypothetical protein